MRIVAPIATVVLSLALLAGCGGSDDRGSAPSTEAAPKAKGANAPAGATAHECKGGAGAKAKLRATGVSCAAALGLTRSWEQAKDCAPVSGSSRSSCDIAGGYRCLSVVTDRGISVSCARPGRSIAFTAKPD
jgi:hypothetical protein